MNQRLPTLCFRDRFCFHSENSSVDDSESKIIPVLRLLCKRFILFLNSWFTATLPLGGFLCSTRICLSQFNAYFVASKPVDEPAKRDQVVFSLMKM